MQNRGDLFSFCWGKSRVRSAAFRPCPGLANRPQRHGLKPALRTLLWPRVTFRNRNYLEPKDASKQLARRWNPAKLTDSDRLSRHECVFATFDHPPGASRSNARTMAEALALPVASRPGSANEMLVEFSYPTDSVPNHRFPTVADAGDHPFFRPAPEVPPDPTARETCCGWTKPLGKQSPQPEIVHGNESLRVLNRAPRFVGRVLK